MVRIIRIAGVLIAFFVITDFVVAPDGGDVEGSSQGSDTTGSSESGNPPGGYEVAGMTAVLPYQEIRDPGYVWFQQNVSAGDGKKRTCLCAMQ